MDEHIRDVFAFALEIILAAAVCFVMLTFVTAGQRMYSKALEQKALSVVPSGLLTNSVTKLVSGVDIVDIIELNNDKVDIVVVCKRDLVEYEYFWAANGNLDFTVGTEADFINGNDLASRLKMRNPTRYQLIDTQGYIGGKPISEYRDVLREQNSYKLPYTADVWSAEFVQSLLGSSVNSRYAARVYSDDITSEILRFEFWEI